MTSHAVLTGIGSCSRAKCRLTGLLCKHRRLATTGHSAKSRCRGLRGGREQGRWWQGPKTGRIGHVGTLTLPKCWGLASTEGWTCRWCWRPSAEDKGGSCRARCSRCAKAKARGSSIITAGSWPEDKRGGGSCSCAGGGCRFAILRKQQRLRWTGFCRVPKGRAAHCTAGLAEQKGSPRRSGRSGTTKKTTNGWSSCCTGIRGIAVQKTKALLSSTLICKTAINQYRNMFILESVLLPNTPNFN